MVVRAALGAGSRRLARQLLTESVVVAIAGAVVGVGLAAALLRILVPYAARFTPRAFEIGLDAPVLLFTLGVSIVVGIVSGTLPLLTVTRDLASGLRARGDVSQSGARRGCAERALVIGQVAASVILLAAAGLSVRSMIALSRVDTGYRSEQVLSLRFTPSRERYTNDALRYALGQRLFTAIEQQPGVSAVTFSANVPLAEGHRMSFGFIGEGQPVGDSATAPQAEMRIVTGAYFKTIGVPLLRGRTFDDRDRTGTEEVAVISRSFARRIWGDADPVGRRISGDAGGSWIRVIGVAGDVRDQALDKAPADVFYVPFGQYPGGGNLLIRSTSDPRLLARNVTDAVHAIDPDLPVDAIRTLSEIRLDSLDAAPTHGVAPRPVRAARAGDRGDGDWRRVGVFRESTHA